MGRLSAHFFLNFFLVLGTGRLSVNGLELINGEYHGLVVKIADSVPHEQCRTILENLEATLTSASQFLFSALDSRAYLRGVSVLLPGDWPDTCVRRVVPDSGETPDITVLPRDGIPTKIHTQQSLGCGQPGDQVYFGYEGLMQRDDTLGRTFVKEFAKYRYGVFDEQGYQGDSIYPLCYRDDEEGNRAKVTGCSDQPITDFTGICSDPKAKYNTTIMTDTTARTSIMFSPESPSVSMFCDEGNHNKQAPTKHNLLCQRRSVLDTILGHKDFASENIISQSESAQSRPVDTTPMVVYKKRNVTRYVFVIENTEDMVLRESWVYLRLALRQWISDVVNNNTEVGLIVAAEGKAKTIVDLIPAKDKKTFYSSIPYTTSGTTQASCLHCALRNASQMLMNRSKTHGRAANVIVVIAPGMDESTQLSSVLKDIKKDKIKIAAVNYPAITRKQTLDVLAEETDGVVYTVFEQKLNVDTTLLTTYFELHNALYNMVQRFDTRSSSYLPVEIYRREITDNGRTSITGSFMIDPNMGEPAKCTLFTHNSYQPLIKGFKLISPSHQIYEKRNDEYLFLKMITIDANLTEPGTWTYVVEPYPGNPQPHFLQVTATPKSPSSPVVTARFWTHKNDADTPMVLLADVKFGTMPILGAKVEVAVTKTERDGTVLNKYRMELLDSGSGDPDITKGDGIYTRYFSAEEWGPGVYTFQATVSDNGNTAYTWSEAQKRTDNRPCCGSVLSPLGVQPIIPFQRVLPPITKLFTHEDLTPSTLVGRIGDLRVETLPGPMRARLSWTAPDMGGHSVSRYEVKYAFDIEGISDAFETKAAVWDNAKVFPLGAGSETTCNLDMAEHREFLDKVVYFAVKAFPKGVNTTQGLVSNWVRMYIPKPLPPPTAPPLYSSTNELTYWPNQENNVGIDRVGPSVAKSMNIGIELILPIAIGFILLVIILILYCYFCVVKKKDRNDKKPQKSPIKTDNNITIVPTTPQNGQNLPAYSPSNEVADPHMVGVPVNNYAYEDETKKRYSLVHQQEQQLIEELKQQQLQRDNTYSAGVSVISNTSLPRAHVLSPYNSWTASQLLHEHERRHSPLDNMVGEEQVMLSDNMQYNDHVSMNGHHLTQIPEHYIQGMQGHIPPPVPPLPAVNGNGYPVNYAIYGTHQNGQVNQQGQPIYQSMQRGGEVMVPFNNSLQGSVSSVNSAEKKRRNVTMV